MLWAVAPLEFEEEPYQLRKARKTSMNEDLEVESVSESDQFNHYVDEELNQADLQVSPVTDKKSKKRNAKGSELGSLRKHFNVSPLLVPG